MSNGSAFVVSLTLFLIIKLLTNHLKLHGYVMKFLN